MSRWNTRRKKHTGRFTMLPDRVLEHAAVRTLSHAGFRVLVLVAAQYRGRNNGALGLTPGQAAESNVRSQQTFYRAIRELEERNLIERTYHASRVPPRPTMYAVTWLPIDDTEYSQATRTSSHAYRDWQPQARRPRGRTRKLRTINP